MLTGNAASTGATEMLLPESYLAALALMVLSMLCWGSWANTLKLCPGYRFQLFYWDYALGLMGAAIFWGLTAGSHGQSGAHFLSDAAQTPLSLIILAMIGGAVFNVANLLLVAAIDIAGMAVAFPVGIGLALIVGAVSSYFVHPVGNPLLLFGGVALVMIAIALDAEAYRAREGKKEKSAKATTTRGLVLSLVAGVLMGCFYPFVARAMSGTGLQPGPGPYAVSYFFALGVLISTGAGKSAADVEAIGRKAAGGPERLCRRAIELAPCRHPRWSDLVYRRRGQFCRLWSPSCRARSILFHRPRRYNGLRLLGCLRMA